MASINTLQYFPSFFLSFFFEVALAHIILPAPRALWFCSDSTPAPCRRARHLDRLVARSAPILLACLLTQAVAAAAIRHWCVLSCGTLALPLCIVRPFSRHLLLVCKCSPRGVFGRRACACSLLRLYLFLSLFSFFLLPCVVCLFLFHSSLPPAYSLTLPYLPRESAPALR